MRDWRGKRVVIVGAARQGLALARYLAAHGARVVLTDQRPLAELAAERESLSGLPVEWVAGGHPLGLLDGADLLCLSGGVSPAIPLAGEARQRGIPLSNDSQIFMEAAPCKVIGITGSAGKTTTTTLVGRIAQAAAEMRPAGSADYPAQAWVGGNIGSPLVAKVDEMGPDDLAIMELSSFQLEIMDRSADIAAVLNVTPNHLDRHGTMAAYLAAKARILEFMPAEGVAVIGRDDPGAWSLREKAPGRVLTFGWQEPDREQEGAFLKDDWIMLRTAGRNSAEQVLPSSAVQLRGEHNLLNVLAACAIAAAAGLPAQAMQAGVKGFSGVPHRLEFVRRWAGADWYNDSIATAPERSMAAIRSFDEPLVLLAGGRDKNLPWQDLARLVHRRIDHLIVFGEAAGKILAAIEATAGEAVERENPQALTVDRTNGLKEAVQLAARMVEPGDVVLLSPGGTSFDEFRDFEERGACFAQLVRDLR